MSKDIYSDSINKILFNEDFDERTIAAMEQNWKKRKTHKRFLCLCSPAVLAVCVIITIFALYSRQSVHAPSKLSVLELGLLYDSSDTGKHLSEYELWSYANRKINKDKDATETATVTFNGKTYTGEYEYSDIEMYNLNVSDHYDFKGGCFTINRDNGQLESILFFLDFDAEDKPACNYRAIAENIARQYIDLSQYTLVSCDDTVHSYEFIKTLNGIETTEKLSVGISPAGDVITFSFYDHGDAFDNRDPEETKNLIDRLVSQETIDRIEAKISTIYDDCLSYKIFKKTIVELENGRLGMVYTLDVELEPIDFGNGEIGLRTSRIELLICESDE